MKYNYCHLADPSDCLKSTYKKMEYVVFVYLIIMKWLRGKPRDQFSLFTSCLADIVSNDNEVRLIDGFVDGLILEDYGFNVHAVEDGRLRYQISDL